MTFKTGQAILHFMKFNQLSAFIIGVFHIGVGVFIGISNDSIQGQAVACAFTAAGTVLFALPFIFSNTKPGEPIGTSVDSRSTYTDRKVFTSTACGTVTKKTLRQWNSGMFAIDAGVMLGWITVNADGTVPEGNITYIKQWWE